MIVPAPQSPPSHRPPFLAFNSRYLRGVAIASFATTIIIALNAAVYFESPAWAGRYLFSGIWALVFFALTPLILKYMLFENRMLLGLAMIAVKFVWVILMMAVCLYWVRQGIGLGEFTAPVLGGISTPLIVVVLRAIGSLLKSEPPTVDQTKVGSITDNRELNNGTH